MCVTWVQGRHVRAQPGKINHIITQKNGRVGAKRGGLHAGVGSTAFWGFKREDIMSNSTSAVIDSRVCVAQRESLREFSLLLPPRLAHMRVVCSKLYV